MKHAYFLAFGAACACWPVLSHAQTGVLAKDTARNGAITFMRLDTHATPKSLAESNTVLRTLLKLTPDDELRVSKQQQDELGYTHQWHAQYYRGIPVEYGTYVVHARNQVIETINGELIPVKNLKATPALDEKAALQKALANTNATVYKWQVPTEEQWIKSIKKDANATFYPKGELLITRDGEKSTLVRLAYKFAIYAVKPASSDYVYVDAYTGDVFKKIPIAQDANSPGTAATRYSQTRNITTDAFVGGYRLRETGRGAGSACGGSGAPIETYNMQLGSSFGAAVDFVNGDNNWVGLNNPAKDNAALDAHWGAESTYDYFNTAHCRSSYDNAGSAIKGYVHTNLPGLGYADNDNAFWDTNLKIMVYGDGTRLFSPLTALDVVAHELGHGYAQYMVGFDRTKPEANALNEGLSDIWGACVEYSVAPSKQTWKIGEDITQTASCLRNLASPNSGIDPSTSVTGGYPDVYNGQYYDSSTGEPHTNSTILSHCFYLLAAGGSGSNSSGTAFNITGVGIGKASDIVFRAENNGYITPIAGFQTARSAMIQAAAELYGSCSVELVATTNAWYAVGVGAAAPSPAKVAGPAYLLVGSTATYTVQNQEASSSGASWSSSNTSIATINSSTGVATVVGCATGSVTFTARYFNTCGPVNLTLAVQVGTEPTGTYYYNGTRALQTTNFIPSPTRINMTLDGPYYYAFSSSDPSIPVTSFDGFTAYFDMPANGGTTITARATNSTCSNVVGNYAFAPGGYYYSVAPNPASSQLVVTTSNPAGDPPFDADLYDGHGHQVKTQHSALGKAVLDIQELPDGLYVLRAGQGKKAISEHIQIIH